MSSAASSALSSALTSAQSSRSSTPLPPVQAPNPYRLPRFWRGYALGGLTTAGAYGLYKLGSALKNYFNNKFHRQPSTALSPYIRYQAPALPTPTPQPTPYQRRNIRLHENLHYH